MSKLTDMQLVLLSAAAQSDHGVIDLAQRLSGAVARQAGERLLRLGLASERLAQMNEPSWRVDEQGERMALFISAAGLTALGLLNDKDDAALLDDGAEPSMTDATASDADGGAALTRSRTRPGTKKAAIIALISQPEGALLCHMVAATGWLPHTARAALTGLRKDGLAIVTSRASGELTRYRLDAPSEAGAAPGAAIGAAAVKDQPTDHAEAVAERAVA